MESSHSSVKASSKATVLDKMESTIPPASVMAIPQEDPLSKQCYLLLGYPRKEGELGNKSKRGREGSKLQSEGREGH